MVIEWFVLVPPFSQPILTLRQPYWIGFLVHHSSALMYPLFAWLPWPISVMRRRLNAVPFARRWAMGAGCILALSAALGGLAGALSLPLPLMSRSPNEDQRYIRHMTTHHQQDIELVRLAVSRAQAPHLPALAALMLASQTGENHIFARWWDGWFAEPMPICSDVERSARPGYLTGGTNGKSTRSDNVCVR